MQNWHNQFGFVSRIFETYSNFFHNFHWNIRYIGLWDHVIIYSLFYCFSFLLWNIYSVCFDIQIWFQIVWIQCCEKILSTSVHFLVFFLFMINFLYFLYKCKQQIWTKHHCWSTMLWIRTKSMQRNTWRVPFYLQYFHIWILCFI